MEQQTTIRITRSVSSGKHSNHENDFSTQATILKNTSEREIIPKRRKCSEKAGNICDLTDCDCKPDQCKESRSNPISSPGYVLLSPSTRFQIPPNDNQSRKHLNSSTQATILRSSSERQITPKKRKCAEDGCDDCNSNYCECDYVETKQEYKPDQFRSKLNPPTGYGIPSQNIGFQVPPNGNQMPFNQARFSCPCPDYQAPGTSPTDDELWDLQFCRWWGWNWIRKRDEMINKKQCESAPKRNCSCQCKQKSTRKHPRKKRDIFTWFRSPKTHPCLDMEERQRLNDLYDTPSCSTNECICPADDWECRSLDFKGEYSCYCDSAGKATSMSTIVIKNHKCGHLKKSRSVICEKMDSTTSEDCCAPCKSCTEESSDCVTLRLKCVKSECQNKIPCECGLKRNRNVCPCKVYLCDKPKQVCREPVCCEPVCCKPVCCEPVRCKPACCKPVCCKPVCCEPVCRSRKKKSSPFICLPSRKPPACKPIPFLCQNHRQRQPPCCVPKLCKPLPTCKYQFPKILKRCPQQNVGCVVPKKEYVLYCKPTCKKQRVCCTNDKGRCCCCCCCCCCKDQLKSICQANKREGTSKTFSGKQSDASDSTKSLSSNQRRTNDGTPRKHQKSEKQLSVSNSLQSGKYVSPLSGRNYALNAKMVTISPITIKSKLPAPIDTNDEVFNFASIPPGDWEHTKLLQAVCDAVMSARSHNEETKTLSKDPNPEWLTQSIGDSKLIEEKPKFKDPKCSAFKENTFLSSLLDTLDDKYFNNLEKNFPKFTPLASLPEEESFDTQCENNSCVLEETLEQKSTAGSSKGSNSDFKINDESGPSTFSPRSLIPYNSPRTWLTEPKFSNGSIADMFSSVSKKSPTKNDSQSRSNSSNKQFNVYDVLFSAVQPNFEPSDSKILSPRSHELLLHEIPRSDVTEHTQTSNFVFNPTQTLENERGVNIHHEFKSKRSKIPVLVNREKPEMLQESPRSTQLDLNRNAEYGVKEQEEEKEIGSDFLDQKYSSIFRNVQSTVPVFAAPNLTENGTSFSKINPGMARESSKEILLKFSNFSVPKVSSGPFLGSDVLQIPTTSPNAGTSSRKMKYTKLKMNDNFIVGDDVITAKSMKKESPFSMFCKPVKSSSLIKLLPVSAKRSLLSRPEKRIFLNRSGTSQK